MTGPERSRVDTCFGQVSYLRAGAGFPVVLIHGSLTTADDMALALFEKLSGAFDVIAFDRPGHGGSDRLAEDPGSPRAQGRALLAALRMLAVPAPVIVGHSFGGAVALAIARDRPDEITSVVALAPICFPELPARTRPARSPRVAVRRRSVSGIGWALGGHRVSSADAQRQCSCRRSCRSHTATPFRSAWPRDRPRWSPTPMTAWPSFGRLRGAPRTTPAVVAGS